MDKPNKLKINNKLLQREFNLFTAQSSMKSSLPTEK